MEQESHSYQHHFSNASDCSNCSYHYSGHHHPLCLCHRVGQYSLTSQYPPLGLDARISLLQAALGVLLLLAIVGVGDIGLNHISMLRIWTAQI